LKVSAEDFLEHRVWNAVVTQPDSPVSMKDAERQALKGAGTIARVEHIAYDE
jgi:molecular chaperone DnaK (HSP70)